MNILSRLLLDPTQPAAWLLISTGLAIVATNLAWFVALRSQRARSIGGQIVAWLGSALFCMLPPLLAWQAGVLSPFYLGLSGLDWISSLMSGAPVIALVVAVLLIGWLVYRRTLRRSEDLSSRRVSDLPGAGWGEQRFVTALRAPLDAALCQLHWAFYRALAISWIATWAPAGQRLSRMLNINQSTDVLYWGSWLGLLFVAAEWALNPFARAALRRPHAQERAARQVALAIATTALFALTRNLWLCLTCHVVVETLIAGWLTYPETTAA